MEARLAQAIEADDYVQVENILRSNSVLINTRIPPGTLPLLSAINKKVNNTTEVLLRLLPNQRIIFDILIDNNNLPMIEHLVNDYNFSVQNINVHACAMSAEREPILQSAISRGANINALCDYGRGDRYTALHYALLNSNITAFSKLLSLGADPNIMAPTQSETALHLAIDEGQVNVVRQLLLHGADMQLKNRFRMTALKLAQHKRNAVLINLFEQLESIDNNLQDLRATLAAATTPDEQTLALTSINEVLKFREETIKGSQSAGRRRRHKQSHRSNSKTAKKRRRSTLRR